MIKLTALLKEVLSEGGNVFGTTSPIKKEDIEPTITHFKKELARLFPKKAKSFNTLHPLGSAGKKPVSGDIDLGYDVQNFFTGNKKPDLEGWGLSQKDYNTRLALVQKRARTASESQLQLRTMIDLIGDKINNTSDVIRVDLKQSAAGSIFCETGQYNNKGEELGKTVQTDINIGNLDWLKFSYYSSTYEGNLKGLHRTQLLVALFANKKYMFKHNQGVLDSNTREVVATSPKQVTDLLNKLYNIKLTPDTLENYNSLMKYLKEHVDESDLNDVLDKYLKILDSTRVDIPVDLQKYWIQNQDRLGLKGKFLPDDSTLTKYKKEA